MPRNILVTGYTGRLGGLVARDLRERHGIKPRVLVRQPHLADWQSHEDVEVKAGDYLDIDSLDAALEGVDAIFLVSPVHPEMRTRELNLAACAARQNNPPHIVKISGLGTRLDSFINSGRWHAEIEHGILEMKLPATFLRPLFFMQNLGFQARNMEEEGILRGGIADAAIAMVDARDIAAVAAAALAGDSKISGQAVSLTGGAALTYDEVATAATEAFGRQVRYLRQSPDEIRAALTQAGQPEWHIEILLQFNEAFKRGWGGATSNTVQRVLDSPPRTLAAYLEELAGGAQSSGKNPFPS